MRVGRFHAGRALLMLAAVLGLAMAFAPAAGAYVFWGNATVNTIGRANLDGSGANQSFITGASNPNGVAVDGLHVYWTNFNAGSIGRAYLDGSGANESFISGLFQPTGVAVDSSHVYWTER